MSTKPFRREFHFPQTLLLLSFLLWAGCSGDHSDSTGGRQDGVRSVMVGVEQAHIGKIEDRREFTGTLVPEQRFTLAAKSSGLLEQLSVQVGDAVQRNQVVGRVDSSTQREELAQAQAEREVAMATLKEVESNLGLAQAELNRFETLREREFLPEVRLEAARAELASAQARKRVAEARVHLQESVVRRAEIRLADTELRTSWEGEDEIRYVNHRYLDSGSLVSMNQPIMEVVRLNPLLGRFFVTEQDYYRIQKGMPVQLVVSGPAQKTYAGKILRIAPEFREDSRRALVEVEVPNPDRTLLPGQFMRFQLSLDVSEDWVIVPRDALVRREQGEGVFVVNPETERATYVPVQRVFSDRNFVAVDGLEDGSLIVVLGQDLLVDGTAVRWEKL